MTAAALGSLVFKKATRETGRVAALVCIAITSCVFVLNPHRDTFTGLDVAMYRNMSGAFAGGRGFHDRDLVFEQVPSDVKPLLLYRNVVGTSGRLTRDSVFELTEYPDVGTAPFFMPFLPLAAASASRAGMSRDLLVPTIAVLWIVCVYSVAWRAGGVWGLAAAVALIFGSAWPAWFLRGFFPEAAGGALLAIIIAVSHFLKLDWRLYLIFGLMLGLSLSLHPTLAVLSIPIALYLVLRSGRWRDTLALALSGGVGTLPLLYVNKYVCQPYGDFTDFGALADMCRASPEIRIVAAALFGAALLGVAVLLLAHMKVVREFFVRPKTRDIVFFALLLICAIGDLVPFLAGGALIKGWLATWAGISLFSITILVGIVFLFIRRESASDMLLLTTLAGAALVFMYIKGVETPVGLWSQRRFTPVILCLISLLAAPLSSGLRAVAECNRRRGLALAATVLLPVAIHVAWSPAAYFVSNDDGASHFTETIENEIDLAGEDAITVFDYYPHSVPYQADLSRSVFGISDSTAENHEIGAITSWLASEVLTGSVVQVVSSYAPVPSIVEDGIWLEKGSIASASLHTTSTKAFFPVRCSERKINNTFYRAHAITEENLHNAVQVKKLDGGPLGLRPPWGRSVRGGYWTMEGSGIVGTVPPTGGSVEIVLLATWFPPAGSEEWREQTITITPPFEAPPVEFRIPAAADSSLASAVAVTGVLTRATSDEVTRPHTGVYLINSPTPYTPSDYGIRGFGEGLGVVLDSAEIRPVQPLQPGGMR